MTDLTPARLAELRAHYERFDKHSPTAIELIDEIERLRSASPIVEMLHRYLDARGIDMPPAEDCAHVIEEACELREAWLASATHDGDAVVEEIADVVLAVAVVAADIAISVEECIEIKTALDVGRGA